MTVDYVQLRTLSSTHDVLQLWLVSFDAQGGASKPLCKTAPCTEQEVSSRPHTDRFPHSAASLVPRWWYGAPLLINGFLSPYTVPVPCRLGKRSPIEIWPRQPLGPTTLPNRQKRSTRS
ncbi:hypothetical protein KC328_g30 [Hortaea werneckii]|nr:hypothetical protein KC328_g30 [Hortaea werneckii]